MTEKQFLDLKNIQEGLVLMGCGGELKDRETGVLKILEEEKIATAKDFEEAFCIKTTGGRTDIVLPFAEGSKINIGKLAMWRLQFGSCSWVSDYKVNYAKQHGVEIEEEDEDEDEDEENE